MVIGIEQTKNQKKIILHIIRCVQSRIDLNAFFFLMFFSFCFFYYYYLFVCCGKIFFFFISAFGFFFICLLIVFDVKFNNIMKSKKNSNK